MINIDELDDDTKWRMRQYAGNDFDKAQEITVEVVCEYDGFWTLEEFQKIIAKATDEIPADMRATAIVVLDGESGKFEISYRGKESDDIVQERVAKSLEYAREKQEAERNTYERLKRKFG